MIYAEFGEPSFSRLQLNGDTVHITPQIIDEVGDKMRTTSRLRKWLDLPAVEDVE